MNHYRLKSADGGLISVDASSEAQARDLAQAEATRLGWKDEDVAKWQSPFTAVTKMEPGPSMIKVSLYPWQGFQRTSIF